MTKKNTTAVEVGINAFTAQANQNKQTSGAASGIMNPTPPAPVTESGQIHFPDEYPREYLRQMDDTEIANITESLLKSMTFQEKTALLCSQPIAPRATGCSSFIAGVPRLGIPAMVQNDGPSGPNAIYETTNLPVGLLTGCTFSPRLAYEYGKVLGRDLKSVGANWQLGAQYDLTRSPYWLRCRDTFGEDYYLTGEMAVAETMGLQDQCVGAMAKHMGAYSTNGDGSLWIEVDEQTLHTAYLYPFEQAVKRANVSSIMTTYNRINGYYCASNLYINKIVPRDLWNWKGNITTDAGGNQEFSLHLGTDNEMATTHNNEANIRAHLRSGAITMADIDTAVRHILWGYGIAGYLGMVQIDPDTGLAKEDPQHTTPIMPTDTYYADRLSGQFADDARIAKDIAQNGMVLLRNQNHTLPLSDSDLTEGVALIGFGAKYPVYGTGFERSQGVLEYIRTPGEALTELCPEANLTIAPLHDTLGRKITSEYLYQDEACTKPGLIRTYGILAEDSFIMDYTKSGAPFPPPPGVPLPKQTHDETTMAGKQTGTFCCIDSELEFLTNSRSYFNGPTGNAFSYGSAFTWKGYLKPAASGETTILLQNIGADAALELFDGNQKLLSVGGGNEFGHGAQWEFDYPTTEGLSHEKGTVILDETKVYRLLITASAIYPEKDMQLRLTWYNDKMRLEDQAFALKAARENKTVLYFARMGVVGHMGYVDPSYTLDVNDLAELRLIQQAAKEAGNRFIVCMNSRSAFSLEGGWLEDTDALVAMFYGGQCQNQALCELLLGKANFSGKLCVTIPKTSTDVCTHTTPELKEERWGTQIFGEELHVAYSEKLDFGYRWNERNNIEPGYEFGYGLSYTNYTYTDGNCIPSGDGFDVMLIITNTGDVTGDEIVQVYLGEITVPKHIICAKKQLAAFGRTGLLAPGESTRLTLHIGARMLSYWDPSIDFIERPDGTRDKWVLAHGTRNVFVGSSSKDIRYETKIQIS